jgi:hypothetical protein
MHDCEQCDAPSNAYEWSTRDYRRKYWDRSKDYNILQDNWEMPSVSYDACAVAETEKSLEEEFHEQADKWERETRHVSSMTDVVMHSSYQAIIKMGPDVIPFLLRDMEENRRFWFTALSYITGENPVKPRDAGRVDRMATAWLKWGKEKGLL